MYSRTVKIANQLFKQNDYASALGLYRQANERIGNGLFDVNIEICERRLKSGQHAVKNENRRILFVSDHTYIPHRAGGRESSINDLAEGFARNGWDVYVVAKSVDSEPLERESSYLPYNVIEVDNIFDAISGLSIYLQADRIVASVDGRNIGKFLTCFPSGSCLFIRDNSGLDALNSSNSSSFVFVANSTFTANEAARALGIVIPVFVPLVNIELYRVSRNGKSIVFINPIPKKGLRIALEIARKMPNVDFLFCESWPLKSEQWSQLEDTCSKCPNVRLRCRVSDMTEVYAQTKILLVPSIVEEAWGRVVTEAQASGIPCIVNDIGGLRESCGEGGIVMPISATADDWVREIDRVLNDDRLYSRLSAGAQQNSLSYARMVANYVSKFEAAIDIRALGEEDRLRTTDFEGDVIKDALSQPMPLRVAYAEVMKQISTSREPKRDYVNAAFDLFYMQGLFSLAVYVFENNKEKFDYGANLNYRLAISYYRNKCYRKSSACWSRLFQNSKHCTTPHQLTVAAYCAFESKDFGRALRLYSSIVVRFPDYEVQQWIEKAVISAIMIGGQTELNEFEKVCSRLERSNWRTAKAKAFIYMSRGDFIGAKERYLSQLSQTKKNSVLDYANGVYLCLKSGDVDSALELSDSATERFPKQFKGPVGFPWYRGDKTGHIDVLNTSSFANAVSGFCSKKPVADGGDGFVCSWPGLLNGNRYMDEFRAAFERKGIGFLPIDMPSACVVSGARVLILQWPDVIKWRFPGQTVSDTKAIMYSEVNAVRRWRAQGVRIVWVVHNVRPHDLPVEEMPLWNEFYDLLGDQVDKFVSMSPSGHNSILREIASLRGKAYGHFYHPLYKINRFSRQEISRKKHELGLNNSMLITAVLGSISWYKGIPEVIRGFADVKNSKARLLIAGRSRDTRIVQELKSAKESDPRIIVIDEFLSEHDFDLLAMCSDKIVVPNKEYLNSGAIVYALSARKPVLALNHPFAIDMKKAINESPAITIVDRFTDDLATAFMSQRIMDYKLIDLTAFRQSQLVETILDVPVSGRTR